MNTPEIIVIDPQDTLIIEIEQFANLIRAIPFLDSHDFYEIMCRLNKIINMMAKSNLNPNSYQFKELKVRLSEVLFRED